MIFQIIIYFLIFYFGAIVGSFLNVLILRYNTGVSVINGRSFCFSCSKKLGPRELWPIFSFIFQSGKCRNCQSKISWQYPIVETVTGLLFVGIVIKYYGTVNLVSRLVGEFVNLGWYSDIWYVLILFLASAVLLAITVYDIRHKIIPDGLVVVFSLLALLKILADFFLLPVTPTELKVHIVWYLVAGPVLALPLFLIWFFSKGRWMGLGDPKLVLGIGWFLGPVFGLSAVILAFWLGAIFGIVLLALSKFSWHGLKINRYTEVPFAPFLVLGFLLVLFFNFDVLSLGFLIP